MTTGRHIDGNETWEPADKSFSKHLLRASTITDACTANDGSVCTVNFRFINPEDVELLEESTLGGYKFGEDVEVTVGEGDTRLSEIMDQVVCSMKEGEMSYIKCKTDLRGNKVGELDMNSKNRLKFNAELLSLSRSADCEDLESDERLERGQHHKDRGTALFKEDKLEFAIKRYEKAVMYVSSIRDSSELPESLILQYKTLTCQCYLNLAACYLKKDNYESVIEHCQKALELEPNNVKGLFRKAQAHTKLNDYESAKTDLKKAVQIEPGNKAVTNQIAIIDGLVKKERQMYQKMFT